ncbi:deoxyribodipyrimidine photolyase [Planctomicrobium sp. SH527]|uniref:deoxyribodipyrimidine photolyase n=1 Tax=Planctomicrobium sp. SH527 TaxID=3448123 RepID=UPI003F5C3B85
MKSQRTPLSRIRALNSNPVNPDGNFILYWMTAQRRSTWNFGLQRAVQWAEKLNRPLVILEALQVGYRWANDRIHRFVLQGMANNRAALAPKPVTYYAYVEPQQRAAHGLFDSLAQLACVVVTDDFPCFFLPILNRIAGQRSPVLAESIDSNGLLPLSVTDHAYPTAYAYRRFLQKELAKHIETAPTPDPLSGVSLPKLASLPENILAKWPEASDALLTGTPEQLQSLPIDHHVVPAAFNGGQIAANQLLTLFMNNRLDRYGEERNSPENESVSGLSPHLHFGHISPHEIFHRICTREEWTPDCLSESKSGSKEGWWGMSPSAEQFLDQLITWRELGFNMCTHRADYDKYESLPDWAKATLKKHERDPRETIYTLDEFENAKTHDPVWNAAQRQLVRDGRMHNYLRMLWGKKILEWTESPRQALEFMIELNNKYAVDGRDPNSYSGIFWVLGRYDRAWGPERPVYGTIRYMSSENTLRKLRLKTYLAQYAK